ncbi:MAG: hypothetical protein OXC44_06725 [Proteobacteria bacterium]|nr:hypothetical protein [Pseudomonadota bacterium]
MNMIASHVVDMIQESPPQQPEESQPPKSSYGLGSRLVAAGFVLMILIGSVGLLPSAGSSLMNHFLFYGFYGGAFLVAVGGGMMLYRRLLGDGSDEVEVESELEPEIKPEP